MLEEDVDDAVEDPEEDPADDPEEPLEVLLPFAAVLSVVVFPDALSPVEPAVLPDPRESVR